MKRYPHTLKRDGLFSSGWTLMGPVMTGRFRPATRQGPGVYHSNVLRIQYDVAPDRRVQMRFATPRLARGGHRLMGEARLGGPERGVEVRSSDPDEDVVRVAAKKQGVFRRHILLYVPPARPVALLRRQTNRFDVDLDAEACRWLGAAKPAEERKRRVYEAAVAMFLAAIIENWRRENASLATAGAGAAAGVAAGAATRAVVTRVQRERVREGQEKEAEAERERHGRDEHAAPSS